MKNVFQISLVLLLVFVVVRLLGNNNDAVLLAGQFDILIALFTSDYDKEIEN